MDNTLPPPRRNDPTVADELMQHLPKATTAAALVALGAITRAPSVDAREELTPPKQPQVVQMEVRGNRPPDEPPTALSVRVESPAEERSRRWAEGREGANAASSASSRVATSVIKNPVTPSL